MRAFAWTGAALFAGALAWFLVSYTVRFGTVAPGPPDLAAVLWNTALFSTFALHHSLFARLGIRAWIGRHVPDGLERSVYVWVASLLLIAVCAWWRPVGGLAWRAEGAARWAIGAGQLAGVWLSIRSAAIIDVFELAGIRPAVRTHGAAFTTAGPYGWVRHPIYAGWFLLVFCTGTMTATRLMFAVVSSLYVLIAIPFEERSLRTTAGDAYDRYCAKVRWRIVPGVY